MTTIEKVLIARLTKENYSIGYYGKTAESKAQRLLERTGLTRDGMFPTLSFSNRGEIINLVAIAYSLRYGRISKELAKLIKHTEFYEFRYKYEFVRQLIVLLKFINIKDTRVSFIVEDLGWSGESIEDFTNCLKFVSIESKELSVNLIQGLDNIFIK